MRLKSCDDQLYKLFFFFPPAAQTDYLGKAKKCATFKDAHIIAEKSHRMFLCSLQKGKYLWVMLLNLEMNNKETELISTEKGDR